MKAREFERMFAKRIAEAKLEMEVRAAGIAFIVMMVASGLWIINGPDYVVQNLALRVLAGIITLIGMGTVLTVGFFVSYCIIRLMNKRRMANLYAKKSFWHRAYMDYLRKEDERD